LLFFQSFYGSLEPGTPHHINSIPSIPLRPLSTRIHPHGTAPCGPRSPGGTMVRAAGQRSCGFASRIGRECF
jgi:hypothetical protein